MKWHAAILLAVLAQPAAAQIVPMPESGNLRMQNVEWAGDEEVLLTILPGGSITVLLETSQRIERITSTDSARISVRVTPEGNAFALMPTGEIERSDLLVETEQRTYRFVIRTQESALAGLVVRFLEPNATLDAEPISQPVGGEIYSYRFRGDVAVRPLSIRDDATRTFIEYAPDQALPAVFAIGPSGEEEVVNGYMREGVYVIDRVYGELVFRIDRERATARRNTIPDAQG